MKPSQAALERKRFRALVLEFLGRVGTPVPYSVASYDLTVSADILALRAVLEEALENIERSHLSVALEEAEPEHFMRRGLFARSLREAARGALDIEGRIHPTLVSRLEARFRAIFDGIPLTFPDEVSR